MMQFLRSQSQTVLIVVLVLGVGFLFYGSAGNLLVGSGGGRGSNDYGRIDGEDLSVAQVYDAVRTTRDRLLMSGQARALQQPGSGKQVAEAAWAQMLLEHEAERLHIVITDQEVLDRIRKDPSFQKEGAFNQELYTNWLKNLEFIFRIPSDGSVDVTAATEVMLEKIIREELQTQAAMNALFNGVRPSAHDASDAYQRESGTVTVSYVTFDTNMVAGTVKVTPADIEAEYKDHPTNPAYRTKEQRKVDYVLFMLTPEQQKLPADEKAKAKDALGQKALDFALAFQPNPTATPGGATPPTPDFQAEAKKRGLTPATTGFFTDESAPAGLPPSPNFNSAAFALNENNPISKVVDLDNGVAVIHLDEIQASQLRPLDQVKADIEKQLLQSKTAEALEQKAKEASDALKTAVAKGTDFKTAAAALKLNVTTPPPFVPGKISSSDTTLQVLSYNSVGMKPGDVSAPMLAAEAGGKYVVAHLDSRGPADPAGLAAFEKRYREQAGGQLRSLVYLDWVDWKSQQPGTHKPPDLDAYGGVD